MNLAWKFMPLMSLHPISLLLYQCLWIIKKRKFFCKNVYFIKVKFGVSGLIPKIGSMDFYNHMHYDIAQHGSRDSSDSYSLRTPIFCAHRDFKFNFPPEQENICFITLAV